MGLDKRPDWRMYMASQFKPIPMIDLPVRSRKASQEFLFAVSSSVSQRLVCEIGA